MKSLANQMMDRDKRCAVLITSSIAARISKSNYSASKAAMSNFGEAIHFELKKNVDVFVWEPGYIYSNFHLQEPPSKLTVQTDKAVFDALEKLGKERTARGSLLFDFYPTIFAPSAKKYAHTKKIDFEEH